MTTFVPVKPTLTEPANIKYITIHVKHGDRVEKGKKIATFLVNDSESEHFVLAPENGKISTINNHYLGNRYSSDKVGPIAMIEVNSKIENLEEKKRELSKSGLFQFITDTTATKKGANYTIRDQTMSIDEAYDFLQEYIQDQKRLKTKIEKSKEEDAKKANKPYYEHEDYSRNAHGGRTKHRIHQKSKNLRKHKSRKHKSRKNHRKSLRR